MASTAFINERFLIVSILILSGYVTSQLSQDEDEITPATFFNYLNLSTTNLPSLECVLPTAPNPLNQKNYHFGEISWGNVSIPFTYYKLEITPDMKETYFTLATTTCCNVKYCDYNPLYQSTLNDSTNIISSSNNSCIDETLMYAHNIPENTYYLQNSNDHNKFDYNKFCDEYNSLDTILHLLEEDPNGQLHELTDGDDLDDIISAKFNGQCGEYKSYLDLTRRAPGEYIIAVEGYSTNEGAYALNLFCEEKTFPLTPQQINPVDTTPLECMEDGQDISGAVNGANLVYYTFEFKKPDDFTSIFPLQFEICGDDTTIYIAYKISLNYMLKPFGENQAAVSLRGGECRSITITELDMGSLPYGTYYIIVQATGLRSAEYKMSMQCGYGQYGWDVVWGFMGAAIGCMILLLISFYTFRPCCDQQTTSKGTRKPSSNGFQHVETSDLTELSSTQPSDTSLVIGTNTSDQHKENEDKEDILEDNPVTKAFEDVIKCCDDKSGFDIFQVLALCYYLADETDDNDTTPKTDNKLLCCFKWLENIEGNCRSAVPLKWRTTFLVTIIALTQTYGITTVVYLLIDAYLDAKGYHFCDRTIERWEDTNVVLLKFLTFLLSLVVSFHISIYMDHVKNDGLYQLIHKLSFGAMEKNKGIAFGMLLFGQLVNVYVCGMAIIGSYFIIFSANDGEKAADGTVDYRKAGLDMILNAVALFFLMELDNVVVTDEDYKICGDQLRRIKDSDYTKVIRDRKCCGRNNCGKKGRSICGCITLHFHCLVKFVCFACGVIAPFLIFMCW